MNHLHPDWLNTASLSILNIQTRLNGFMPWLWVVLYVFLLFCVFYLAYRLRKTKKRLAAFMARRNTNARQQRQTYNSLTTLPGRTQLEQAIQQRVHNQSAETPAALLLISVDNLGRINDVHNHAIGDTFLRYIALRLKRLTKENDFLAHLNSNKFALLLPPQAKAKDNIYASLQQTAQTLQRSLEAPYFIDALALRATIAIGLTLIKDDHQSAQQVIQQAHMALNQARTYRSKNIQFFNQQLCVLIKQTELLAKELPFAIERNQLAAYVHPQHDMHGRLSGVELLLRWHHPKLGVIDPERFIPLAEKDNLINHLGLWMLDQAASFIQRYPYEHLSVSINVSPLQFHSTHVGQFIRSLKDKAPLLAPRLVIEITEGAVMENLQEAQRIMQTLTRMGYRLSLDDFGTGYSNLAAISSFPLYEIKLDRSLVHNLAHEQQLRVIAEMVIKLAKTLRLKTVAEGVENKEDLQVLANLGFDYVQGFYYSRPMPLSQWSAYLEKYEHSHSSADQYPL